MSLSTDHALVVDGVKHQYGDHCALNGLSLQVAKGQVFAILGPNGSGKSTLFRLVATLAKLQAGEINVCGRSVKSESAAVRAKLGVVFQSPSLDPKLTSLENIRCQGALYGLVGQDLTKRASEVAKQLGIEDRLSSKTEDLSGGLKRRVELAKSILHRPPVMLMDEPSTGLDPAARLDLWHAIKELQQDHGVTVILTTHLLEEAEKADQIAIIDSGVAVACGEPNELRASLGGQLLSISTTERERVVRWLQQRKIEYQIVEGQIRVLAGQVAELVPDLSKEFGSQLQSLTLGQPSLEDVFVAKTGHTFWKTEGGEHV